VVFPVPGSPSTRYSRSGSRQGGEDAGCIPAEDGSVRHHVAHDCGLPCFMRRLPNEIHLHFPDQPSGGQETERPPWFQQYKREMDERFKAVTDWMAAADKRDQEAEQERKSRASEKDNQPLPWGNLTTTRIRRMKPSICRVRRHGGRAPPT
jgi:hypothetical protein